MSNSDTVTTMTTPTTATEATYRILDKSEHASLLPLFEQHGWLMPDPRVSMIAVAEVDGKVVSHIVFQVAGHLEQLWVEPSMRGKVNPIRMAHLIEAQLPVGCEYFMFCSERAAEIAAAGGATFEPVKVMRKFAGVEVQ